LPATIDNQMNNRNPLHYGIAINQIIALLFYL